MPEMTGIELLKLVKKRDNEIQVIVITGHPDVDFAVEAIRSQVDDYLIKPFEMGQLRHAVYRALEHRALVSENRAYREHLEERVQKQAGQIKEQMQKHQEQLASQTFDGDAGGGIPGAGDLGVIHRSAARRPLSGRVVP